MDKHRIHGENVWTYSECVDTMYGQTQNVWIFILYPGQNVWTNIVCMDKHRMCGYLCTNTECMERPYGYNAWTNRECMDMDMMYGQTECIEKMYGHGYNVWTNRIYGEHVWTEM